jgi:flagellar motor switch protein FliN/FliY
MNLDAANVLIQGFLKGGFDVYNALLGLAFEYSAMDPEDGSEESIGGVADSHPVAFRGTMIGGGSAALLFTMEDATKIVSLTEGGDGAAGDSLDEAQLGTLKEIADGVLGGGVANLSESFGEDVESESIEVVPQIAGAELAAYLGAGFTMTRFTFKGEPHFDSEGIFLHSHDFEARVPGGMTGEEPLVSDEEMKDILSGFSPDDEPDHGGMAASEVPENLGVILGIELNAVARLGKMELPISEVLGLGPGAILDVGHLVDEPVELLVNNKLIARGDVVVVDEKFGLRITEIVSQKERIESFR